MTWETSVVCGLYFKIILTHSIHSFIQSHQSMFLNVSFLALALLRLCKVFYVKVYFFTVSFVFIRCSLFNNADNSLRVNER